MSRCDDAIAAADSTELFEEYLGTFFTEGQLVGLVMQHLEGSGVTLSDAVREVLADALGCLTQRELVEQVVLNEADRRAWAGYHKRCCEEAEARRAREAQGGRLW